MYNIYIERVYLSGGHFSTFKGTFTPILVLPKKKNPRTRGPEWDSLHGDPHLMRNFDIPKS